MNETQQIALDRAQVLLKAAGVQFAIRTPDGVTFGELPVAETKARGGWKKVNKFAQDFPGYIDKLKAMKPGDVLRWTPGADRARSFQSAVAGSAGRYHGPGTFITTVVGPASDTVEILLVGK